MKKTLYLTLALFFVTQFVLAGDHHGPHWTYEGHSGPEHWGELDPAFKTCETGKSQSPVNLVWSRTQGKGPIEFSYKDSPLKIIDNGHTVQVNFEKGSTAKIRGHEYALVQMHFHTPSEHTLSSKNFPIELHFVHKDADGKLAVIGVMYKKGTNHPGIETIWSHVPSTKGEEKTFADIHINPSLFLPKVRTYYNYIGSLTTPPCSEGVNWNVLNTPVELSSAQIAAFQKIYSSNNRPVQFLNGRKPANF